jgi:hypothetical protein
MCLQRHEYVHSAVSRVERQGDRPGARMIDVTCCISLYEFLEGTRLRFRIRYEGYDGGLRAR